MKRKYDKHHRAWAKAVRARFNNQCVVCGTTIQLCAHHLIPWEIEKYRYDVNNGIAVCPKHHTGYGYGLSPHSHGSILFAIFLKNNFPFVLKWIEDHYDI